MLLCLWSPTLVFRACQHSCGHGCCVARSDPTRPFPSGLQHLYFAFRFLLINHQIVSAKKCLGCGAQLVNFPFNPFHWQVVVHGLVLTAFSRISHELLCVGADPSVYAVTWRSFLHYVLLECVSVPEEFLSRTRLGERALVNERIRAREVHADVNKDDVHSKDTFEQLLFKFYTKEKIDALLCRVWWRVGKLSSCVLALLTFSPF